MSKNLSEFVGDKVVDYLSDNKSDIFKKISKLDDNSLVIQFLRKFDLNDFECYLRFKKYSFAVYQSHECPKCHKQYSYPDDDDVDWYSGDTEYENNLFADEAFGQKYYPCCDRSFTSWWESGDEAEEDAE